MKGRIIAPASDTFWSSVLATSACHHSRSLMQIQMSSPYQLSSTHPVCGYQKGTPLAIGTPNLAVLRFIVGAASLFMLLDSPGDTGGPLRYRGDNSPSDIVSQPPT